MTGKLPAGIELARFRPRLLDDLRHYDKARFGRDVAAGLAVGIVALPLAMAFGIASGVTPEQGLITAIVGGFLVSALGGSTVQIGGPAGAFIVIVYGILQRYGLTHLLIATALSGVLLFALGLFRLGALVRHIPASIVIGVTNGIAVLIALSQVKDLLGLDIARMPAGFFAQIEAIAEHLGSARLHSAVLGLVCVVMLFVWPRLFGRDSPVPPHLTEGRTLGTAARIPAPILVLVTLSAVAYWAGLPVETLGSRFGGIPQVLPTLALPPFSWASAQQLLIPTLTLALLGAVESLLCARIADNLIDGQAPIAGPFQDPPIPSEGGSLPPPGAPIRHNPDQELMAQGVANMVVPFFGGLPVTGTLARTVTNLRAGATSPVAGIVHALALLLIVLLAAPLAAHVPLAVLAGILVFVAWNMGEWHEFMRLQQVNLPHRVILIGTFLLTVTFDLTVGIEAGLLLACVFFIHRMSTLFRIDPLPVPDTPAGVQVLQISGTLFFGTVDKFEALVRQLPPDTHTVVVQAARLISMDRIGLDALMQLHRQLQRRHIMLVLAELNPQPLSLMQHSGFAEDLGADCMAPTLAEALAHLR